MRLFAHEGITPGIRCAFVAHLTSHNRPVHEGPLPAHRYVQQEYERNFRGMRIKPMELDALLAARDRMVREQEV